MEQSESGQSEFSQIWWRDLTAMAEGNLKVENVIVVVVMETFVCMFPPDLLYRNSELSNW